MICTLIKDLLWKNRISIQGAGVEKETAVIPGIINDIRRIFQVIHEHSQRVKGETGLTGPQLWAIQLIGECSSVRVSELASRMYVHSATVVGILNRLRCRG